MFPRLLKIFIVLVLVSASLGRKCFEELRFHGKTSETLPIEFSDRFLVGSVYSGDAETKFTIQRNDDFFFNVTVLEKGNYLHKILLVYKIDKTNDHELCDFYSQGKYIRLHPIYSLQFGLTNGSFLVTVNNTQNETRICSKGVKFNQYQNHFTITAMVSSERFQQFFLQIPSHESGLFFSWPGVLVLPLFVLLLFSVLSNVVVCYFRRRNGEGDERPREPLPPVPPPLRVVPFGEDRRLRQKEERPQLRNNEYLDTERDSINSVYGFNNAISPLE
ncbi:uncharacterized protein LOC143038046 isoform X1 [Oratosquilla oratoria]|uniref:uncharacterized protein LOC143038046 isoform X1 n=1 Tax=Oratosquilla oratoria TaxID=337810 RepID=UPI003F76CCD3